MCVCVVLCLDDEDCDSPTETMFVRTSRIRTLTGYSPFEAFDAFC